METVKNVKVAVDTALYFQTYGKEPEGKGAWWFEILGETVWLPPMDYFSALECAMGKAALKAYWRGVEARVIVLP